MITMKKLWERLGSIVDKNRGNTFDKDVAPADRQKEVSEAPEEADIPEVPEEPEAPEEADIPEAPERADVPEPPERAEVSEAPEELNIPEPPEEPDIPEVPEKPGALAEEGIPKAPEEPAPPEDQENRTEQGQQEVDEMAFVQHKPQRGVKLQPLDVIEGFEVRPGFYNRDGATAASNGVSFTIHSMGATSCTLLLFYPQEKEPYAKLQFPESYHIGNTYSMLVFGLKIEEFEYAFQLDGPYDREKGLLFDKNHVLLDPYAKAVTGQRNWGERPEDDEGFVYHARVVENNFDWGNMKQLELPLEDLVIYEMHVRGFTRDESSGVTAKGTYEGLRQKIPYLKDLEIGRASCRERV